MAIEYVDSTQLDSDLTSVANAIRAKSGGSSQLAFPAGFVSEIQAIPSGGGGGNSYEWHTISFTLASSTPQNKILATYVQECALYCIYPADSDNTNTNTIAYGHNYGITDTSVTTPTGVNATPVYSVMVNDQSYNVVRSRANVNNKPAGDYYIRFYGIANGGA